MDISRNRKSLGAALIVATIATTGSLYFSIGMGLIPCRLCWFQRIFMYPLVIILGVSMWEDRVEGCRIAIPLASLGWIVAAVHSYIQIAGGTICTSFCSVIQFRLFGVLSIPNLSLIGFTVILLILGKVWLTTRT